MICNAVCYRKKSKIASQIALYGKRKLDFQIKIEKKNNNITYSLVFMEYAAK